MMCCEQVWSDDTIEVDLEHRTQCQVSRSRGSDVFARRKRAC